MCLKVRDIARLTRDPELTVVGSKEINMVKFGVAKNDYKDKAHFFDVTAFSRGSYDLATIVNDNFKKGDQIFIDGKLDYGTWEDKDGNTRHSVGIILDEFQFVGGKKEEENAPF